MTISEVLGQDLPRYGAVDCDYSFSSEGVSSFADDLFEFSPQDHRDDADCPGPSPVWDSRDIVFCGKLIPTSPQSNTYAADRMDQTVKRNRTGVAKKARVITYSSARCDKWYMLAFGLARFPSEMVMSEIRRRQGKKNPGGANTYREIVVSGRTRGKKGGSAWGMQKDLGGSRRDQAVAAGAVVKSSFGCFPRL